MDKVTYLQSQIACAYIELEAMKIENELRKRQGLSPAYGEKSFLALIDHYGLGTNSALDWLRES